MDEAFANCQSEACTTKLSRDGGVALRKGIEYGGMLFGGNADTAVLHRNTHFASAVIHMPRLHCDCYKTAIGKFHCVMAQVVQHLTDPARVSQAVQGHLVGQFTRHGQTFLARFESQALQGMVNQCLPIDRNALKFHLARFDF